MDTLEQHWLRPPFSRRERARGRILTAGLQIVAALVLAALVYWGVG